MASQSTFNNPFPGIRSYEMDESRHFFGREQQIAELTRKLETTRFLAIVGSSGCGKSSLIKAGLIPRLLEASEPALPLQLLMFRPGSDPLGRLAEAIAGNKPVAFVKAQLAGNQATLSELIPQVAGLKTRTLLYIDQFEELFRFRQSSGSAEHAAEAARFVETILEAIHNPASGLFVILSMRTDFLDDCTTYRGLSEAINMGYYLVPRMNEAERRRAITGPITEAGATITGELVETLLNDTGDDPDQLPILQHALMRTWEHWTIHSNTGQPIGLQHYEAIGTMKEALSVHLEELYESLPDERNRFLTEKLFKALTDVSNQNRGTRRPTPLDELCALTSAREEELLHIIDRFRSPGCAFLMPPAHIRLAGNSLVDISHESIMRVWTRLKKWVEDESESAQLYLRLSRSAALFQEGKTGLWVNPELQLALQWKTINKPNIVWASRYDSGFDRAIVFLENSRQQYENEQLKKERQQKRNLRRARNSAIVLGIASAVSILFLVISLNLRFKAEASRREALEKEKLAVQERKRTEEQRKVAIVERKISEQQQQIAEQQELIANQQRQYAVAQQQVAQQQTAEAVRQRKQADQARQEALTARDEAEAQRLEALAQKHIADTERLKAETSEEEAQRLRMLAIANAMAVQAVQLHANSADQTAALLALTAYRLHRDNGGQTGDPAIFEALSAVANDQLILRGHKDAVRAIALMRNEKTLFSCGDDGQLLQWNLDNTALAPLEVALPKDFQEALRAIALTASEKWLIAASDKGRMLWWNMDLKSSQAASVAAHHGAVVQMLPSPTNESVFTAGADGKLIRWDLVKNEPKAFLIDQLAQPLTAIALSNDEELMAYAEAGGLLKVIHGRGKAYELIEQTMLKSAARSLQFTPDSRQLLVGCTDGSLHSFNIMDTSLKLDNVMPARHISSITAIDFAQNNALLATSSFDWTIKVTPFPVLEEKTKTLNRHEWWVYDLLFRAGGKQIISCSGDKTIRIHTIDEAALAAKIRPQISRNLSPAEWQKLVGSDVPYQKTIEELP